MLGLLLSNSRDLWWQQCSSLYKVTMSSHVTFVTCKNGHHSVIFNQWNGLHENPRPIRSREILIQRSRSYLVTWTLNSNRRDAKVCTLKPKLKAALHVFVRRIRTILWVCEGPKLRIVRTHDSILPLPAKFVRDTHNPHNINHVVYFSRQKNTRFVFYKLISCKASSVIFFLACSLI